MVGWRAKLGFLVPAGTPTVEPEMFEMAPKGVSVHFGRMISRGADGTLNGIEARIATQIEHLDESVEMLSMIKPEVIALAHTATSYYLGREKEAALTKRLEDRFGLHFITAFGSVIAALHAMGITKVALGTPYDENLTMQGKQNLESYGIEVVNFDWLRNVRSIFEEPPNRAYRLGKSVDVGMPTVSIVGALEQDLGKPVISSSSAMMWNALRLAGVTPVLPGYGSLLA
jgi:maleate cis-trans isomerase